MNVFREVYVEFSSAQAATTLKRKIESFSQLYQKKYNVYYAPANSNPYRTLPKDAPNRKEFNKNQGPSNQSSQGGNFQRNNFNNRGSYNNNRGSMGGGNFNQGNRSFSGPMGGVNSGFGSNIGFNPQMGIQGMGGNFGFNRGGTMGGMNNMRGGMQTRGRGGMNMGGISPGMGMGMGNMNMGMGMNMMGGGMPGMGMMGKQNFPYGFILAEVDLF